MRVRVGVTVDEDVGNTVVDLKGFSLITSAMRNIGTASQVPIDDATQPVNLPLKVLIME